MRLPLEHEDGEFADFRLPAGSKAEAFGPSAPMRGCLRCRDREHRMCSNRAATE
jgi:hypothetical protein